MWLLGNDGRTTLNSQNPFVVFVSDSRVAGQGSPNAMLPTYIRRPSRETSSTATTPVYSLKPFMGRPLLRWIPLVLGFLVSLWVFGPFIMDLGQPLPLPLHKDPLKPPHPPHPPPAPHHPFPPGPPTVWSTRADRVRDAFVHAYSGYHQHAYPYDELLPVEGSKVNK